MWLHGGLGLSNELWAFDTKVSNWSFVSQAGYRTLGNFQMPRATGALAERHPCLNAIT
ncbi:unnamed protein product [Durusdinium trenchii]|uniref:Uncharacterized protein n=1 Tax=Durusdinium trenchii TaxID=1381693 RepID=A0ABP0REY8_9DINO